MCGKCRDEYLKYLDNVKYDVCRYEDRKFVFFFVLCKVYFKY